MSANRCVNSRVWNAYAFVGRLAVANQGHIGGETTAQSQYSVHLGIRGRAVRHIHCHVLPEHGIECRVLERQTQSIVSLEGDAIGLSATLRQVACRGDNACGQIDAGHLTSKVGAR